MLEDLKARRDSLFHRARRASVAEEKENAKQEQKDKRRSSEGGRRSSVFYVSQDLLEENQEVLENERMVADMEGKKGRRKSWHPLAKPPKFDRKRRKGIAGVPTQVGSTDGLYAQTRQKRPSWWNIFVPDSVARYLSFTLYRILRPCLLACRRVFWQIGWRFEVAQFSFSLQLTGFRSNATRRVFKVNQNDGLPLHSPDQVFVEDSSCRWCLARPVPVIILLGS